MLTGDGKAHFFSECPSGAKLATSSSVGLETTVAKYVGEVEDR
jgi:hypothetical protein